MRYARCCCPVGGHGVVWRVGRSVGWLVDLGRRSFFFGIHIHTHADVHVGGCGRDAGDTVEVVKDSVFYSIPKAPKEGVHVKGASIRPSMTLHFLGA